MVRGACMRRVRGHCSFPFLAMVPVVNMHCLHTTHTVHRAVPCCTTRSTTRTFSTAHSFDNDVVILPGPLTSFTDEEEAVRDKEEAIRDKEEAICEKEQAIRDKEEALKRERQAIRDKEVALLEG